MIELRVEAGPTSYPFFVGAGLLERIADLVPIPADRAALIFDVSLPADLPQRTMEALESSGIPVTMLPVRGEESKSMPEAERLARAMAEAGVHRTDVCMGLGGGATTDLSGFVSAIYHRGIEHIALPTTLLGMVDASIGGKTGVNLPEGKNLVGAFHQPQAVIADVDSLVSLPEPEMRSGMAEVVKHGLIGDPALLELVATAREADGDALATLVSRAVAVKINVVAQDVTEKDVRAHLNYGHTLGHAIETLGHAGVAPPRRHGEAVAIGMMFVAHLAARLGYADTIDAHRDAIAGAGLPVKGAAASFDDVLALMRKDKKYDRGLRFVVLEDLARPTIVSGLEEEMLRDVYESVR